MTASSAAAGAQPSWSLQQLDISDRPLYQGKASAVFRARDRESGTTVALKLYKKSALTALNRRQVERELAIHQELHHENIIHLLGTFQDQDHVYLVQEFAGEGDLFQRVKLSPGGRFSEVQTQRIILPFLRALVYLHSLGIIHRDIKPENVVLASGGVVKLTDFGLAISMNEERPVTRLGTLDYMAPEVLSCPDKNSPEANKDREDLEYCCQVDVWAAGVLAYELLVGKPPFEQGTRLETYQHIMYRDPPMPDFLSPHAASFMKAALCKDPEVRPTAEQLIAHPWLSVDPWVGHNPRRSSAVNAAAAAAATAAAFSACATTPPGHCAGAPAPFTNPFVVVERLLSSPGPGGCAGTQPHAAVAGDSDPGLQSDSDSGSDSHSFFGGSPSRDSRDPARAPTASSSSSSSPARASADAGDVEVCKEVKATLFELHLGRAGQEAAQAKAQPQPSSRAALGVRSQGPAARRPSDVGQARLLPTTPFSSTSPPLPITQPGSSFRSVMAAPESGAAAAASTRPAVRLSTAMPDIAPGCSQGHEGCSSGSSSSRATQGASPGLLPRNHSYEPSSSSSGIATRRAGTRLLARLDLEALSIDQSDSYQPNPQPTSPSSLLLGSISAEASAISIAKLRSADLDAMLAMRQMSFEGSGRPGPKAGVLSSVPVKAKAGGGSMLLQGLAALVSPSPSPSPSPGGGREDDGPADLSAVAMMRSSHHVCKAPSLQRPRTKSSVSDFGQGNFLQGGSELLDRGPGLIFRRPFLPSSGSREIGLASELPSAGLGRAPAPIKTKAAAPALPLLMRASHGGGVGRAVAELRAPFNRPQNKSDRLIGARTPQRAFQAREPTLVDAETPPLPLRRTTSCTGITPVAGARLSAHSSPGVE